MGQLFKGISIAISLVLALTSCSAGKIESTISSPQPQKSATESPRVSLENLDPDLVRPIAFQEVRRAIINSKSGVDRVNHVFDKGANKPLADKAISMIPKMAGFFDQVAPVENYTIVWTKKGGSSELQSILCEEADYCEPRAPEEYCNMGELQYAWVFCEYEPVEDYYLFPIFHAYVHIQQYAVAKDRHMPTWFGEGVASYFEGHFSALHYNGPDYSNFGNSRSGLIRLLYENQNLVEFDEPATEKNVIDGLEASSNRFPEAGGWQEAQLGYYLGFVAVEALIASYGLETFMDFWRLTAEKDFYEAFRDVYGISTSRFHKKLAPYAVEMMLRGG